MASQLLVINPSPPPSKRGKVRAKSKSTKRGAKMKQRRTAAQKAATKKLVALNKRRAKGGVRKKNPAPKRKSSRGASPSRKVRVNPSRRRGATKAGIMNDVILPVIPATGGALALDFLWGFLPLPVEIKTGAMRHVAKAGGAVALSLGAEQVLDKRTAEMMGVGALTVIAHEAAKEMLLNFFPTLNLGYYSAGVPVGTLQTTRTPQTYQSGGVLGEYVGGAPRASVPAIGEAGAMGMYEESEEAHYYAT